uniref:ATP synthase F0 subunit 8 n=1 Tax=Phraortes sp. Miyako Island TaxID=590992 RepID=E2RUX3_9NEOP|nr:ATP synthase F0 subunit 8 [Phraortes sp. Miyako Island]
MPQMAPMSWIIIYMTFITILLMFNMKMYFQKKNQLMMKTISVNKINEKSWKW